MRSTISILAVAGLVVWVLVLAQRRRQQASVTASSASTNISSNPATAVQGITNNNRTGPVAGSPSQMTNVNSDHRWDEYRKAVQANVAMAQSPITYFGKVIDESNWPISGVTVSYTAYSLNASLEDVYNRGTVTTDGRGIFKVDGVQGINLMVELSHSNYYPYPDNSTGFDKRGLPRKGYFSDTEEKAEIFRMHRKGHPVPLVHRIGGADVPVNRGSATVKFYGGRDNRWVVGTLQIEASGNTPPNYSRTPYDWSVRLTVPDGGLVEFTNRFDFVAPDSGYQESIEIDMDKDQPGWSDTVTKSYFVKIPGGYLRMGIYIAAKTPLFTSLDYFYNPDGSQNLEPK